MSELVKRLRRPGYDLQKEQAIQEAIIEIRELRAKIAEMEKQEPVAAQHRFRHPHKNMPNWTDWWLCDVVNRPAWEIDSKGYEVEYRALYLAAGAQGE